LNAAPKWSEKPHPARRDEEKPCVRPGRQDGDEGKTMLVRPMIVDCPMADMRPKPALSKIRGA
jgi:hypothetical protein